MMNNDYGTTMKHEVRSIPIREAVKHAVNTLHAMQDNAGSKPGPRSSPAEDAKAAGNRAFAAGNWEEVSVQRNYAQCEWHRFLRDIGLRWCGQAADHYSKALELDPLLLAAQNNRAMCWLKLGQFQRAATDCDSVLSSEPTNVKALLRRGTARDALGQRDEAMMDYWEVLRLQPTNQEAEAKLSGVTTRIMV